MGSGKFSPRTPGGDPMVARVSFEVATLGRAIVHAADLGARVIDISEVTCLAADRPVDQAALGAAIRYAAVDKDAVIVAAAGNTGSTGSVGGGMSCESNPLTDLGRPDDARNWAGVTSVSIAVVVAAVRAVGGFPDAGRAAVEIHHVRAVGGHRGPGRKHCVGEQSRRRRPGQRTAR